MKKLFTLVALLACFLGAKAEWVQDYKVDYSQNTGFPFYVMGYVPEWIDGVMTDFGANYSYKTDEDMQKDDALKEGDVEVGTVTTQGGVTYHKIQLASAAWHQYFIADGIPTEIDGSYTVKAMVKASEAVTVNVNMGWGWGEGQQAHSSLSVGTDWAEVECEFTGIASTSCNLVAQPGNSTATIEWKYVIVGHNAKAQRPTTWQQWLTNDGKSIIPGAASESKYMGDAEFGAWPDWALEKNADGVNINWRGDRTGEICAWGLAMGRNAGDTGADGSLDGRARPYPADIEVDATDATGKNHVFAVHADKIEVIDDDNSIQWSNQFWIQSPQPWKEGSQIRIKFRYRAEKAAKAETQIHKEHPSDYLHWEGVGDVNFTTEWQEFDKTITFNGSQATGWSLAFNLCAESTKDAPQEANVFYFDDLSWETMVLDEGYFIAGSNPGEGLEYDLDNAIAFEDGVDPDGSACLVATVGEKNAYVSQVMISTVRGNDAAFKSNTLKPEKAITNEIEWMSYAPASLAKISLPAEGIWKVYLDTEYTSVAFEMLEGKEIVKKEIKPNPTEIVIHALERDDLSDGTNQDGTPNVRENEGGTGEAWDNQFWIVANRALATGEVTKLQFKYKATKAAKSSTQCHVEPGAYKHWSAIGDVNFTDEWQDFEQTFTVPSEANEMKSIAFNLAEIKEANDYEIKDVVWKLDDDTESLINETGTENFFFKGVGGAVTQYEADPSGVSTIVVNKAGSAAIYNLAGQRVSKDYKGLVVKDGKKTVLK